MGYDRKYSGGGGGGSDSGKVKRENMTGKVCQKNMFEISPEKYVSKEVKADGGHRLTHNNAFHCTSLPMSPLGNAWLLKHDYVCSQS